MPIRGAGTACFFTGRDQVTLLGVGTIVDKVKDCGMLAAAFTCAGCRGTGNMKPTEYLLLIG